MRRKRPPTKLIRIRISDLKRMKEYAKQSQKQLPDFQSELIKIYKKKQKERR